MRPCWLARSSGSSACVTSSGPMALLRKAYRASSLPSWPRRWRSHLVGVALGVDAGVIDQDIKYIRVGAYFLGGGGNGRFVGEVERNEVQAVGVLLRKLLQLGGRVGLAHGGKHQVAAVGGTGG